MRQYANPCLERNDRRSVQLLLRLIARDRSAWYNRVLALTRRGHMRELFQSTALMVVLLASSAAIAIAEPTSTGDDHDFGMKVDMELRNLVPEEQVTVDIGGGHLVDDGLDLPEGQPQGAVIQEGDRITVTVPSTAQDGSIRFRVHLYEEDGDRAFTVTPTGLQPTQTLTVTLPEHDITTTTAGWPEEVRLMSSRLAASLGTPPTCESVCNVRTKLCPKPWADDANGSGGKFQKTCYGYYSEFYCCMISPYPNHSDRSVARE
jgi:hypothetical protein